MELLLLAAVLLALSRNSGDGAPPPVTDPEVPPRTTPTIHPDTYRAVNRWRPIVEEESRGRANVWSALMLALILKESRGEATAVGATDDFGLCQITRPAWQDYQVETNDPDTVIFPDAMLDPRLSVRVGAWFLNRKIEEMGNARDGLRAYNAGSAGARRNPNQSAEYADSILRYEPIFRVVA